MKKTVVLYRAEIDESQPTTRHCGIDVREGPAVIAWVGTRADGVQLHLSPEVACRTGLELIRHALHASYDAFTDDAVQRAMGMLIVAHDAITQTPDHDHNDDPPRGVHAH